MESSHKDSKTRRKAKNLRVFVSSWLVIGVVTAAALVRAAGPSLDASNDAWQRGDYVTALNGYIQLLNGPGGGSTLLSLG